MKRGVSMFPFLLIFVVIAGAFILIFFFQFGTDLQISSSTVNKLTVLKNIDQQLAAFALPGNALNSNINLGTKADVDITCEIKNAKPQTKLAYQDKAIPSQKLIVSPIKLQARTIQAWTLSWDYPFKVDNFYYIIPGIGETKNVKIFIKDPPSLNEDQANFIKNFKFQDLQISSYNSIPNSDKKIVFILDPSPANFFNKPNTKTVKVDFTQAIGTRKVKVYEDTVQVLETDYLGDPLVLAAAFARSKGDYKCIEKQAKNRLNDIIKIYNEKLIFLTSNHYLNTIANRDQCSTIYSRLTSQISNLVTNPDNVDLIVNSNKQLIQLNCPELYLQ